MGRGVLFLLPVVVGRCVVVLDLFCPVRWATRGAGLREIQVSSISKMQCSHSDKRDAWCGKDEVPESNLERDVTSKT